MKTFFLSSSNFWTNVITAISIAFIGYEVTFPAEQAAELVDSIMNGQLSLIIIAMFNFGNSMFQLFKDNSFQGKGLPFLRSSNFWISVATIVGSIFLSFNIDIPAEMLTEAIEHGFTGNWSAFVISIFNIGNVIFHILKGRQPVELK